MFSIFNIPEPKFNRRRVNVLILKIQRSTDERLVSSLKFDLFKMMKKIVVKNTINYESLYRNSKVTSEAMERDEIVTECYMIMNTCVMNYKVTPTNCFYFYFNKSLARSLYRMLTKDIRDKDKFQEFHTSEIHSPSSFSTEQYDVDFLMTFMNLDHHDKKVLKSKLRKEKKDEFLNKKGIRMSSAQYQNSIKKIKKELQIFVEDGNQRV